MTGPRHQLKSRLSDVKLEHRPRIIISVTMSTIALAVLAIASVAVPVAPSVVSALVAISRVMVASPVTPVIVAILDKFHPRCHMRVASRERGGRS